MNAETAITKYQSSLRAFLVSHMGASSDVDDILQDALIKAIEKLHTLNSEEKIKPWLFQITRNAMMDHYRRKRRERSVAADGVRYDASSQVAEHVFEGCIEPFLDALPNESGELLRAVELQGVSQKAYAERLGINYSTLKSRVQASRKQLRQLFDQCCEISFAADGPFLDCKKTAKGCNTC